MHVDVVAARAATRVQVIARGAAIHANSATLGGIEGDGIHSRGTVILSVVLRVVEVDVGTACAAMAVKVSLGVLEIVAAITGHKGIGVSIVCDIIGGGSTCIADVEAGDKCTSIEALVTRLLVEQVDVVAA